MRINSSNSFQDLKTTNTEATPTKPATNTNATTNTETIKTTQNNTTVSKDGRASMRSAEMGIGARIIASQIKTNTDSTIADNTVGNIASTENTISSSPNTTSNNLWKSIQPQSQTAVKTPADPEKKTMAQLFGVDAFQQNLTNDGSGKSKAAAAKGAKAGAQTTSGTQASGGTGEGEMPMSLGALLAFVGSIMVKAIEKTMKQLEDAAKQLDAATGGGGSGSGASGTGANDPTNPANPADPTNPTNSTNPADPTNSTSPTGGTDTSGVEGSNGTNQSPLDLLLNKLSGILGKIKDLIKQVSDATKQLDSNNAAGNGQGLNTQELSNLLNQMKSLQADASKLGGDAPKLVEQTLAQANAKMDGLTNLINNKAQANVANNQVDSLQADTPQADSGTPNVNAPQLDAPQADAPANAPNADGSNPSTGGTNATPSAPQSGGGGGPTAALNQKIQLLTFNLQQLQQSLNRVNETVTNLSRSQSEAEKSIVQNLSV